MVAGSQPGLVVAAAPRGAGAAGDERRQDLAASLSALSRTFVQVCRTDPPRAVETPHQSRHVAWGDRTGPPQIGWPGGNSACAHPET